MTDYVDLDDLEPDAASYDEAPRQGSGRKAAHDTGTATEDAAAIRFAAKYAGRLRYCHDTGAWFGWDKVAWRPNRTGLAFRWARELARGLAEAAPAKARGTIAKTSFAAGVERFCRSDPVFAVTAESWDTDPWLLGTPAGTVDLRTGKLRRSDQADGITKLAAVAPADEPDCPLWLAFLDQATGGDVELIRFLQQWCGYSLTGSTREHALVFIYGPGGNGKSVFLNVLSSILGDYATTAAIDTFTASAGDRHTTDLAMLRGARLVTASETEEGRAWAEARIKQLTGGDLITARFMRQDNFTFLPTFKLTIVGNHQPALRNVDEAARRRFRIVPFVRKPAQPDATLEDRLRAERPAILRWIIAGCLDWQENGLITPASVVSATDDYFVEQDLFGQWLADSCELDPGNDHKWEQTAELFASWTAYAKAAGDAPGSTKSFAPAMRRHGIRKSIENRPRLGRHSAQAKAAIQSGG
ncbi:phage/plasmid primase, P4 family [uncultured Enterovirga sp.]|uniref:phage/plasmid primase, P4 family n=1 Tax=uncultured Enterovirga sp. TaxID=2026352 RepID=UPI0035CBC197